MNEAIPYYEPGKAITAKASVALTGKTPCVKSAARTGGPLLNTDEQNIYVVGKPAAGGKVFGVVGCDVASGAVVPVKRGGIIPVTTAAAVARDDEVMTDANGLILPVTPGKVAVGMVHAAAGMGADAEFELYVTGTQADTDWATVAAPAALVDNSGGAAADGTIGVVDTTPHAADAVKELATKVNAIIAALQTAGVFA